MNRGADSLKSKSNGYTIVETLIFLAVSGLMLTSAMLFISGKQGREQFQSTVRDFESRLTDIANDVSNGYYQNGTDIACLVNGNSVPYFPDTQPAKPLGSNTPCIFVGTVVKLGTGASTAGREQMVQYAMAGSRLNAGKDVTSLAASNPRAINKNSNTSTTKIGGGATVQCIAIGDSCDPGSTEAAAIGFFTTFQGANLDQGGGALQTDVVSYGNKISIADTLVGARNILNDNSDPIVYGTLAQNPGVTICLLSGGSNQYALIRIGGNGSSSQTIASEIKGFSGGTPPCN